MNTIKLQNAVRETMEILDSLNIEFGPVEEVSINTRAKSIWGQCARNKANNTYRISINSELLNDEVSHNALMDTVIHEFLHAHEDRMSHTGEWKRCANLVNRVYGYNIKRSTSPDEKGLDGISQNKKAKYIITCDVCGCENKYMRKSKIVKLILASPKNPLCRCGCCGSQSFTVTQN